MNTDRPTPETDAMVQPVAGRDVVTGEPIDVVHADDCRRLERERDEARERVAELEAIAAMLDAVVQGAQEEFVRVPYGASHEDVAAINDWHKMAMEARALLSTSPEPQP